MVTLCSKFTIILQSLKQRMPLILTKETQNDWFMPVKTWTDVNELMNLAVPIQSDLLTAHTVKKLRGKEAIGNVPESSSLHKYNDLILISLFNQIRKAPICLTDLGLLSRISASSMFF